MERDFFCEGLVSPPCPEIGLVLVTGATGYVGGRLVPELLARGYQVRVLVRGGSAGETERWPGVEVVVGDAATQATLQAALRGVHTAFYLIHSLLIGAENFAAADADNARNFREVAEQNNVHRIIYLGGLGDIRTTLSPHLQSRMQVAEELQSSTKVSITVLHAAIIIGSGSASYEIIYHLVKRLSKRYHGRNRMRCIPAGPMPTRRPTSWRSNCMSSNNRRATPQSILLQPKSQLPPFFGQSAVSATRKGGSRATGCGVCGECLTVC